MNNDLLVKHLEKLVAFKTTNSPEGQGETLKLYKYIQGVAKINKLDSKVVEVNGYNNLLVKGKTKNGKKVLARRRQKGRKKLSV